MNLFAQRLLLDNPNMTQTHASEVARLMRVKATFQMSRTELAKVYAAQRGFYSREGGWIYNAAGRPVAQGWYAFAERLSVYRVIVLGKGINWNHTPPF